MLVTERLILNLIWFNCSLFFSPCQTNAFKIYLISGLNAKRNGISPFLDVLWTFAVEFQ